MVPAHRKHNEHGAFPPRPCLWSAIGGARDTEDLARLFVLKCRIVIVQDTAMTRPAATPTAQIDNDRVRVTNGASRRVPPPAGIATAWTTWWCR
jgi:hypothetical protein